MLTLEIYILFVTQPMYFFLLVWWCSIRMGVPIFPSGLYRSWGTSYGLMIVSLGVVTASVIFGITSSPGFYTSYNLCFTSYV